LTHVYGNLACELEWRGGGAVPAVVARRIAALATLIRALVDDDVTIWTDAAVDPARLTPVLPPPALATGAPPRGVPVLAWGASRALADPRPPAITRGLPEALRAALALPPPSVDVARRANDRRTALALDPLAGAAAVDDPAALAPALAAAAAASPTGAWVAKAVLTSAGRDRVRDDAAAATALLARHGAIVVEPWLDRVHDLAITGAIDAAGAVTVLAPHRLITDGRGGFRGIDLAAPDLTATEHAHLADRARAAGAALAALGHRGPYTVDAFVHATAGARALRPIVEINARLSFGIVARALAARLGTTRLGVGDPATMPAGATVLVAPTADDPSAAWAS
jgi:hypothetical protein